MFRLEDVSVEKLVGQETYAEIVEIWELSVRATHDFLSEEDIQYYKKQIKEHYLDAVDLYIVKKENQVLGFMGVVDDGIEMLFLNPDFRGKGLGKLFVQYALSQLGVSRVDVNEQNEQALLFYQKMGFSVKGRSALDGEGKPYPILHLQHESILFRSEK